MDALLKFLDDAFGSLCVGRPRWVIELALLFVAFFVIHFGYSILATRHEHIVAESREKAQPVITVGPVTTYGPQSGVTIGGTTPDQKPKDAPPK